MGLLNEEEAGQVGKLVCFAGESFGSIDAVVLKVLQCFNKTFVA